MRAILLFLIITNSYQVIAVSRELCKREINTVFDNQKQAEESFDKAIRIELSELDEAMTLYRAVIKSERENNKSLELFQKCKKYYNATEAKRNLTALNRRYKLAARRAMCRLEFDPINKQIEPYLNRLKRYDHIIRNNNPITHDVSLTIGIHFQETKSFLDQVKRLRHDDHPCDDEFTHTGNDIVGEKIELLETLLGIYKGYIDLRRNL